MHPLLQQLEIPPDSGMFAKRQEPSQAVKDQDAVKTLSAIKDAIDHLAIVVGCEDLQRSALALNEPCLHAG